MDRRGRRPGMIRWVALGVLCLAGPGCGPDSATRLFRMPPVDGFEAKHPGPDPLAPEAIRQTALRPEPAPMPSPAPESKPPAAKEGAGFPDEHSPRLPTEKAMLSHPTYVIEAPDVLLIDTAGLVPKAPYVVRPFDTLAVQATGAPEREPVNNTCVVGPDGTVALGFGYGTVKVGGLTLERARDAVLAQLKKSLKTPVVSLELGASGGIRQVRGEHRVQPDGTISLGTYGCVHVNGLSPEQARAAVEAQLSQFFQEPEISLEVFACNSKVYYVVTDGGGCGMRVRRFPITGNETVLDAIERVGGLPAGSSRKKVWVARPAPAHHECLQILPVDWLAVVLGGSTRTNYQLFPGDRVYVASAGCCRLEDILAKLLAPVQCLFNGTR